MSHSEVAENEPRGNSFSNVDVTQRAQDDQGLNLLITSPELLEPNEALLVDGITRLNQNLKESVEPSLNSRVHATEPRGTDIGIKATQVPFLEIEPAQGSNEAGRQTRSASERPSTGSILRALNDPIPQLDYPQSSNQAGRTTTRARAKEPGTACTPLYKKMNKDDYYTY